MKKIRYIVLGGPFVLFLLCTYAFATAERRLDITLRIIPRYIMGGIGLVSFGIFLFGINRGINRLKKKNETRKIRLIARTINICSSSLFILVFTTSLLLMGVFYEPEGNIIDSGSAKKSCMSELNNKQEETENDEKRSQIKKINVEVMTHREDELVFSVSIDNLIESFNGYYWKDHQANYLLPVAQWGLQILDRGIHSPYKTFQYHYTENADIWSLPTINVYVPSDDDHIQEVAINFDEHSYQPDMYEKYEEMCFYTLKVFFPELSDDQLTQLYTMSNEMAHEHMKPNDQGYYDQVVPYALFYKEGIGVYPYFAAGECLRLCIMPVTSEMISDYEKEGVIIHEIQ